MQNKKMMSLVGRMIAAGALMCLVLGCRVPTPASSKSSPSSPSSSPSAPSITAVPSSAPSPVATSSPSSFALGVEYMVPGLASIYGQAGARSTRPAGDTFGWGKVEPRAPTAQGQHIYEWAKVDRYITEYQAAGFDQIQIYTTANNDWASSKPKNYFPDAQYLDDYEAYIFNLVTRYSRTLPNLKYPILDYVIEQEWTEFFPGTTDEYLQLLTVAHSAAKRANPNARVWLVPLMMIDVFDHNPTADEIVRRSKLNYSFRHPVAETQKLLMHPELFDVVEIHSLGDYTELDTTAQWLRGEMKKNGYSKPIFIGDALGISQFAWATNPRALTPNATNADFLAFAPIRSGDVLRVINLLEAMKDANASEHDSATRWFRAENSKALVKKIVSAIDSGYAGINLWALADGELLQQPRVTGDWFFMGMIDAQMGLVTWTPGAPRPAYYTLKMTIEKLKDYTSVERLNLGASVHAYRFARRSDSSVLVAWNEAGRIYFPGESEPPTNARIPFNASRVSVTRPITESGATRPRVELMNSTNGFVMLALDSTPMFIEASP